MTTQTDTTKAGERTHVDQFYGKDNDTPDCAGQSAACEAGRGHTPGPWRVGNPVALALSPAFHVHSERNIPAHAFGGSEAEALANARLIAAAPETARKLAQVEAQRDAAVAALRECADWLARSARLDDQEQASDARAAIAQAEGRAE